MELKTGPDHLILKAILTSPSTLATVLHSIAYKAFGEEMYDWEPETLELEINEEFEVEIPSVNLDKLMALISAITTDAFYRDWVAFFSICKILNGDDSPMDASDPLLPPEMAWAVTEVRLNDDSTPNWSPDVARIVGVSLEEDGFISPPPMLAFAKFGERYIGSDTPADMHQDALANTEHVKVVEEYIELQSLLLFKQLAALPWMTEQKLEQIQSEIRF